MCGCRNATPPKTMDRENNFKHNCRTCDTNKQNTHLVHNVVFSSNLELAKYSLSGILLKPVDQMAIDDVKLSEKRIYILA